ncbi:MAG: hypothetical protein ABIF12_02905 [bacterium]
MKIKHTPILLFLALFSPSLFAMGESIQAVTDFPGSDVKLKVTIVNKSDTKLKKVELAATKGIFKLGKKKLNVTDEEGSKGYKVWVPTGGKPHGTLFEQPINVGASVSNDVEMKNFDFSRVRVLYERSLRNKKKTFDVGRFKLDTHYWKFGVKKVKRSYADLRELLIVVYNDYVEITVKSGVRP